MASAEHRERPVPGADLPAQFRALRVELLAATERVLSQGQFVLGAEVESFERAFAQYCGVHHAVGVGNGTDALLLALRALHLAPGDLVAVPAFTFAACAEAVCLAGAEPLFVDIDPASFNLDPAALRRALSRSSKSVRAIIAVHLYGRPADIAELAAVAEEHEAALIEDAAQAHGARYRERRVGGFGRMSCFSFYPTKNLGAAGDAGAVVTDDSGLAARLRLLRDHGQREKYVHTLVGHNSRLDALQAAILTVKLPYLDGWNARRREIAALYDQQLGGSAGLTLPSPSSEGEHVYHLYTIRCRQRDDLRVHLTQRGIASGVHYPIALPRQRAFRGYPVSDSDFENAERAAHEVLSLPCYPELGDDAVRDVCAAIQQWLSTR